MSDETEAGSASAVHEVREPVYVIGLGNAVVLRLSAYGVLLAFLAAGVFGALTSSRPGPTSIGWIQPVLLVAAYLGVVVVHELVHGLFFRLFGGRPRYGAGFKYFMPYFSAASPGDEFSLGRMIAIGLAPLLTISAAALLGALVVPSLGNYFAVAFIGNAAGAVGDIWMTSRLAKFLPTRDATVVDLADGMAVYSANPRALEIAATVRRSDERPAGFVVHWIGATLAVLALEGLAGVIGPFFGDSVLIGPAQLPLVAFEKSAERISWTFSVASPLVAGLVFAVAAWLFTRLSRRPV